MVEFSNLYSSWIWSCEWGHVGFDFEGEGEALADFAEHHCDRRI